MPHRPHISKKVSKWTHQAMLTSLVLSAFPPKASNRVTVLAKVSKFSIPLVPRKREEKKKKREEEYSICSAAVNDLPSMIFLMIRLSLRIQ